MPQPQYTAADDTADAGTTRRSTSRPTTRTAPSLSASATATTPPGSPSHRPWSLIRRHKGPLPYFSDMVTECEVYPGTCDDPHSLASKKQYATTVMENAEMSVLQGSGAVEYMWSGEESLAATARSTFGSDDPSAARGLEPLAIGVEVLTAAQIDDFRKMQGQQSAGASDGLIIYDDTFSLRTPDPSAVRLYVAPNTNAILMDASKRRLRVKWAEVTGPRHEATDWTGVGLLQVDKTTLHLPFLEQVRSTPTDKTVPCL
ncbi:hypothetical protein I317_05970 [Kwoniella heveanensis CBS 569]|nr:hypothetical protein I317_05970 [Kwoniella heveanensis CBS 569]